MNLYESRIKGADPVYLPLVNDSVFQDLTLEPQMVRVRSNNSANLILELQDVQSFPSLPTNVKVTQYGSQSAILMRKVKRIALTKVLFTYYTPCINEYNNLLSVYRDDTQQIIDIVLVKYQPADPNAFMVYLIDILNAEPGLVGMNFSFIVSPDFDNIFQLASSAGIKFAFSPDCSAVINGFPAMGFPRGFRRTIANNTLLPYSLQELRDISSSYMAIGPVNLTYSPFVDFNSTTLTGYSKMNSASTGGTGKETLYRLFLRKYNQANPSEIKNRNYEIDILNPVWITWNPEESLNTIDIFLTDNNGRPFRVEEFLQIPSVQPFVNIKRQFYGMDWTLVFNTEI